MAGPQWVVRVALSSQPRREYVLVKVGNSKDSLFECRALSIGRRAPVIEVWLGGL